MLACAETIKKTIESKYPNFGPNKRQELVRLLYEISKRENKDVLELLNDVPGNATRFAALKTYLLKRRFPHLDVENHPGSFPLPGLQIDPALRAPAPAAGPRRIEPKNFFVEQSVLDTYFVTRLKSKYPDARFTPISSLKERAGSVKPSLADYNRRLDSFYIIREKYDFFKRCPCSNDSAGCGYHVINLGSGCAFDCHYCFLQDYLNHPGIVLPANLEDFFDAFRNYKHPLRLGSGEYTDSLVFDHITEYSPRIVSFFKDFPRSAFEFKTKSDNVDLLLSVKPAGNIVVSWTFSPQTVIDDMEWRTASLKDRIKAAARCAEGGYKLAFHFDPVIYYKEWERDYEGLVEELFKALPLERIAWISIGTLRMTQGLKKTIENRFPENRILNEEFQTGHDGKLRYGLDQRAQIYRRMKEWIARHTRAVPTYLCMEERSMAQTCRVVF